MARKFEMTWDRKHRRWFKHYRGKHHVVSCRQLNTPETQEQSYQAANAWWNTKRKQIDASNVTAARKPLPLEDLAAAMLGFAPDAFADASAVVHARPVLERFWPYLQMIRAIRLGCRAVHIEKTDLTPSEQAEVREMLGVSPDTPVAYVSLPVDTQEIPPQDLDPASIDSQALQAVVGYFRDKAADVIRDLIVTGKPLPDRATQHLPPGRILELDRSIKSIRGEDTIAADRSIHAQVSAWVAEQCARVRAGQMAPDRADNLRKQLEHFRDFVGPAAPLERIDAAVVAMFYRYCLEKIEARKKEPSGRAGWGPDHAQRVFATALRFIRWLWKQSLLDVLPRNLDSKEFRFNVGPKKVPTWTVAEFTTAVRAATGKMKLILLLMANCGMTQKDVSDLLDDEVDWTAGRITRKRSKTKDDPNAPTVSYRLWPKTMKLLKRYRSRSDRVLLTESGRPFVRKELDAAGKLVKADNIASLYVHLKRKLKGKGLGLGRPLKQIRKLAASTLEKHAVYNRFKSYFLGHSPRTIADKFYVQPDAAMFDEAVRWLGKQLRQLG